MKNRDDLERSSILNCLLVHPLCKSFYFKWGPNFFLLKLYTNIIYLLHTRLTCDKQQYNSKSFYKQLPSLCSGVTRSISGHIFGHTYWCELRNNQCNSIKYDLSMKQKMTYVFTTKFEVKVHFFWLTKIKYHNK